MVKFCSRKSSLRFSSAIFSTFMTKIFKLEKLLALHYNIKTVHFFDSKGVDHRYVFTDKMLANEIFIEYYTVDDDIEEEEYIDDGELEDEDLEEEDESDLDDGEEAYPDYGSQFSVVMKHDSKYYQFLMYHSKDEIGVPIILLQSIVFVVKLIEESNPDRLIEYLTSLSPDPLIPHQIGERRFRQAANTLIKLKIQTIHRLIQEGKADLN